MKQCAHNVVRSSSRQWFDLPLFTCLEKSQDIEIDKRLIDPWFTQRMKEIKTSQLAEKALHSEEDTGEDTEILEDEAVNEPADSVVLVGL